MDKTKKGSRVAPERPNTVKDIDKAGRSDNYGEKGAKTDEGTCRIEKEQTDVEYHHQADQWVDLKDETEHEKSKRKKKTRRKSSDVLLAQDELPQSHSQEIQRLDETEHERSKRKKKKRRKSIDVLSAQDELSQSHSEEIQRLDETEHEKSKRKKKKRRKSIDLLSAQDELPQSHSQEIQGLDIEQSERTDSHHVARVAKNCILIPGSNVVMYSNKVIRKESDWAQLVADDKMNLTNNKFEIEVINTGDTELITMGLVPANYDQDTAVGWHDDSFGYHGYDGGIYIKSRHAASTLTTAKKGDIISLKLLPKDKEKKTDGPKTKSQSEDKTLDGEKEKSLEGEKWIYCIEIRNQKMSYQSELTDLQIGLHPCLAMLSTGAAVRLLDDTLLKGIENTHIPVMSAKETEDLIISPAEAISMSENKRGMLYGLMSIYNKSERPIAFEVYRGNKAGVVHKEILAPKKVWAECLRMQRGDVIGEITVEWTTHCSAPKNENWTLDEICPKKEQREKHILEEVVEWLEEQDDDDDVSTSREHSIRDEMLQLLRSSDRETQVEALIDIQSGSAELTRLRGNIQKDENSINALLQILENAKNCNPRDENTMIDHAERMLNKLEVKDILQTRDDDKNGYTVLHYAALLGSTRLINLLLEKNKRIKYLAYVESHQHKLPLEYAINNKHDETAKALVIMMSKTSIVNLFWNRDSTRIRLSIKSLLQWELTETTNAVLNQFKYESTWLVAPLELDDMNRYPRKAPQISSLDLDYDWLLYNKDDTTAFQMIARSDLKPETIQTFSNHPCVKTLTQHKWNSYAWKMFWIQLVLYLFSWLALTFAAVTGVMAEERTKYDKSIDYIRAVCECWACIISFVYLLAEFGQWKKQRRHYCYDGFNWLDLSSNLLILIVIPLRWTYNNAQWGVFGVGYICWTLRVIKFITMSRILGQLGFIIQGLVADVLKFGVYFLIILLSFSGGLFLALKGDDNLNVHDETSTIWGILFVGVRVLFEGQPIGNLEYTGAKGYRTFSCIVMLLFLALTCAVMLNIFIAQLTSRYSKENDKVDEKFETHKARTIARYDLGEDLTSYLFICRNDPMWVEHFMFEAVERESYPCFQGDIDDDDSYCPFKIVFCCKMCMLIVALVVYYVLCLPCCLIYDLISRRKEKVSDVLDDNCVCFCDSDCEDL